jgi:2-polyprenyl-6-methoxyphenol hydroxylase-like FAD-dependent oxidoreductase
MSDPQRVLIVGGGIAGLATARALRQRGIEPEVVDRVAAWSHPGTGVYLPANSVRALGVLGLQAALLERACEITRQRRAPGWRCSASRDEQGRKPLSTGRDGRI